MNKFVITPFRAVCLGALIGLGCVAVIALTPGLNKYTGNFFGDGGGLSNVPTSGMGTTITNGVFQWQLDATFENTLKKEGVHGVLFTYDHIDGSGATALWRTTDSALHFPNPPVFDGFSSVLFSAGPSGGMSSVANGTGYLHDDGTGTFVWQSINASTDLTGTLQAGQFPALTGDITTTAGSLATTLATVGSAGTFRSVTVNAKGLTTSGSNPTTFSGYGISDSSANLFAALTDDNGSTWTNLTYRYVTNAIPSSGTLVFGQSYTTNTSGANITYGALTIGAAFYESCVIYYTNSSATDSTLTYNGVHGPFGVIPAVLVATNGHMTRVLLEHYGTYTNASKLDL